jgi:hypothetical protein
MICCACDNDLAKCVCPDLRERFERILKSKHVHIGEEYQQRIWAQIDRNEKSGPQTTTTE